MSNMFGIDFGKSLKNKRKKLESLADDSLTTIDKKVMEMVQTQQQEKYDYYYYIIIILLIEGVHYDVKNWPFCEAKQDHFGF